MKNIITQEEKNRIDAICYEYSITNYTINQDGSIDVNGQVSLSDMELHHLPLKFGKVSGNFYCYTNALKSLEGCPDEVGGDFDCLDNKITSLKHCPSKVGGDFECGENKLTSLKHCHIEVGGYFYCQHNKLTSLEFAPTNVGMGIDCIGNKLPSEFDSIFEPLTNEEKCIFFKYQEQYEVWYKRYNHEYAKELVSEIKDGLL